MELAHLAAGIVALIAAAIHGGAGEALILRRISLDALPSTRWGSRHGTMLMLRISWHLVTATFLAFGAALGACGVTGTSEACTGVGTLATVSFGAFSAIVLLGIVQTRTFRSLLRHPAPIALTAVAVLSWLGTRA